MGEDSSWPSLLLIEGADMVVERERIQNQATGVRFQNLAVFYPGTDNAMEDARHVTKKMTYKPLQVTLYPL